MSRIPQSPHRRQQLAAYARTMRCEPTPSEAALWGALSGRKLGVLFRRQVPCGDCIADFLAPSARLIVEVDGGWHSGGAARDARRDARLRAAGYRVLRLPAELVLRDLPAALALIQAALAARD